MSRLALAVFVVAAITAQAELSAWIAADAPLQRLAARAAQASELAQPADFDPFAMSNKMAPRAQAAPAQSRLAWNSDNRTLEEILGSAIWRASAACAAEGPCVMTDVNALRPL